MARMDPHSYTDTEQGTVSRLGLHWTVDFEQNRLLAEASLHFEEPFAGPLHLDTRDLAIDSVTTLEGEALPWKLAKPEGFMGSRLTVERPKPVDALRIRYATGPSASALQWLEPRHTAGGHHPYLFSQCQPIHARSVVPIQDSPRVRFQYEAKVTVPKDLSVVMSARPGEQTPGPAPDATTYSFVMPQPIPAYLLAIAVGRLQSRDLGPRSRVYAEPETLEAAAYEFADIDKMLLAAEELFGPYLWERFDFIVMPPAFPYGGMENPRLTFLTPTLLAGDRSLVNVLAHELAHSWTGNLVTNATMNDFWLNEGFTVWAERRILEKLEGPDAVALAAAIGRHDLQEELQRFGPDSPLTRLETDLAGIDPDAIYSSVPYEKGFLFVSLLEQTVGREAFDGLLRRYIDRFRFTSITTAEFEAFAEEKIPGLLARANADSWLRESGLPDNGPSYHSPRLQRLAELAAGLPDGQRPNDGELSGPVGERIIYLQRVPRPLATEQCRWLDGTLHLSDSGNAEILSEWLQIAAASAYEPAFERIRGFLGSVGRMKFIKPLYAALHGSETTRPLASEIFAAFSETYHPIARAGLQSILSSQD